MTGRQETDRAPESAIARPADGFGHLRTAESIWVYDNWSAYTDGFYDEYFGLPDDTRLTESLAMRQLEELSRLKRHGVRFDYYLMNAFWFDPDGGYRRWRLGDWPDGPDCWIEACYANGIKPGLWFGTNSLWKINPVDAWRESLATPPDAKPGQFALAAMSLHEGGFLDDFMEVLDHWYCRGIRLFEFDVANFDAATPATSGKLSRDEIRLRNSEAFHHALALFRDAHRDAILVGFNGFGGDFHDTSQTGPFKSPIDGRWLDVLDALYTGDTMVSDVPMANFWRSVDLYNDHMTRRFEQSGVPLDRSDSFFTLSPTWFGYRRGKYAWKSMLLLRMARGSWKQTIYGDLSLLDEEDAEWFAQAQALYAPVLGHGATRSFGALPGSGRPYGFVSRDDHGAVVTLVNPSQTYADIAFDAFAAGGQDDARILFSDSGFEPSLGESVVRLGPEQMCVIGAGSNARSMVGLGREDDVAIPASLVPMEVIFEPSGPGAVQAQVAVKKGQGLRILVRQVGVDGGVLRTLSPTIIAHCDGTSVPVDQSNQDRIIATGISWAAGVISPESLGADCELTVTCRSPTEHATLAAEAFLIGKLQ